MSLNLSTKFLETCSLSTHSSFSPSYDAGMFTFPRLSLEQWGMRMCTHKGRKTYIHTYINIHTVGTESIQTPLNFSLFRYIAAICSNHLSSFFFLINVHTAPHIDRKTQNCWHFCRFIKKENWNITVQHSLSVHGHVCCQDPQPCMG